MPSLTRRQRPKAVSVRGRTGRLLATRPSSRDASDKRLLAVLETCPHGARCIAAAAKLKLAVPSGPTPARHVASGGASGKTLQTASTSAATLSGVASCKTMTTASASASASIDDLKLHPSTNTFVGEEQQGDIAGFGLFSTAPPGQLEYLAGERQPTVDFEPVGESSESMSDELVMEKTSTVWQPAMVGGLCQHLLSAYRDSDYQKEEHDPLMAATIAAASVNVTRRRESQPRRGLGAIAPRHPPDRSHHRHTRSVTVRASDGSMARHQRSSDRASASVNAVSAVVPACSDDEAQAERSSSCCSASSSSSSTSVSMSFREPCIVAEGMESLHGLRSVGRLPRLPKPPKVEIGLSTVSNSNSRQQYSPRPPNDWFDLSTRQTLVKWGYQRKVNQGVRLRLRPLPVRLGHVASKTTAPVAIDGPIENHREEAHAACASVLSSLWRQLAPKDSDNTEGPADDSVSVVEGNGGDSTQLNGVGGDEGSEQAPIDET